MTEQPGNKPERDISAELAAAVAAAHARGATLYIKGGDSKRHWLGRNCTADELDVTGHCGIVDYQPAELVVTARAGTRIRDLQRCLAAEGQTLACEPPELDGNATLGGTLATNLCGPARPWTGSIRDAVLGVRLINGEGKLLSFGGTVMKNVAGYDVSRLQAGALGVLGVLCDISLKVLPLPEKSLTLSYAQSADAAIAHMNQRAGEPAPLSGACWVGGVTQLRLSGAASAVEHIATRWGGDAGEADVWHDLRELRLPFFAGDAPLWRATVTPTASCADSDTLLDWAGAQRWLRGAQQAEHLQRLSAEHAGHACLFRGGDRDGEVRAPLGAVQQQLQLRLKQAFDPAGVLNPGRLYSWM